MKLNKSAGFLFTILIVFICTNIAYSDIAMAQNSHSNVHIENKMGVPLYNINFSHRYDNDHFDRTTIQQLGTNSSTYALTAGYWTGFGRTGHDFWAITFETNGNVWSSRNNFYCYLTSDDNNHDVKIELVKSGNTAMMKVIPSNSSSCNVSLNGVKTEPNSSSSVYLTNDWGSRISNVKINHRYDTDHYDSNAWTYLDYTPNPSFAFNAGYWSGFMRTGHDYWKIDFDAEGKTWTIKDNFYCFLTSDDKNKQTNIRVFQDKGQGKVDIKCPSSSGCTVQLDSKYIVPKNNPKSVYVIAHRVNDPTLIGLAISKGANGVECDLHYDPTSKQIYVNHDAPTGTPLIDWLIHANHVAEQQGDRFALVIFDIKFASVFNNNKSEAAIALKQTREIVRNYLSPQSPLKVIFSIPKLELKEVFDGIIDDLKNNEGISIDQDDSPLYVQNYFRDRKVNNVWYADGTWILGGNVLDKIIEASRLRDNNHIIKKVYVWTLGNENSIRDHFNKGGADGVLVNVPDVTSATTVSYGLEEVLNVIYGSNNLVVANRKDNAF